MATVGKWFGNSKKGLIFGIWNSHTSLGNILGESHKVRYLDQLLNILNNVFLADFYILSKKSNKIGIYRYSNGGRIRRSRLGVVFYLSSAGHGICGHPSLVVLTVGTETRGIGDIATC